jgi:hypothetical protein
MSIARRAIAAVTTAALMSASAPAFAGGWGGTYVSAGFGFGSGYGRGYGRKRWRHRDGVDAGDVIAGIAVIGAIAAIASSASRKKRERPDGDNRRDGRIVSEDAAVDACALAAEGQAGRAASVRDITQVDRTADGWDVEGTIEERDDYRDRAAERRRFTCSVRFGAIDHVYIDTEAVALR